MPDFYGNRTTCERQLLAFIRGIVESLKTEIEGDEPISGCNAVDYLADLYDDAKKILEKYDDGSV